MKPSTPFPLFVPAAVLLLFGAACDSPSSPADAVGQGRADAVSPVTPGKEYAPEIDPADFSPGLQNPFFPLVPGTRFHYEAEDDEELGIVTVTSDVRPVLGVSTIVVLDRVYVDLDGNGIADGDLCPGAPDAGFTSELIEETFDWYAPDNDGNVWYFGEDSREYEDCDLVSSEGSWEAGVDDALPGILMLADPVVGQSYRQEYYEDEAEDWARVMSLKASVSVEYGEFDGCLETMDWTPLEPGSRERKFYCAGVGLVLEMSPSGGRETNELVDVVFVP